MPTLFLIAGEVSGDTHGAELIASLRQTIPETDDAVEFFGLGGSKMQEQAPELEDWLDDAAVLGLWEVAKKYGYFREKMAETQWKILKLEPDVVVLIDYPGFNLRLAKALRAKGFTGKIAYYISPQVWAWKRGRIKEMARTLDLMMCIFPFEKALYEQSGLNTEFVGHPLIDELAEKKLEIERDPQLVGLFPGSRRREVEALFPAMLGAAKRLHEQSPNLRFVTAAVNPKMAAILRDQAAEIGVEVTVHCPKATEDGATDPFPDTDVHTLMQQVGVAVIASGTATLEAAYFRLPYCLTYKVNFLTAALARMVIKVDFLGIVNNLAGREVVRELLQEKANPESIAEELDRLLSDTQARNQLSFELGAVIDELGDGGAHARAAKEIVKLMP